MKKAITLLSAMAAILTLTFLAVCRKSKDLNESGLTAVIGCEVQLPSDMTTDSTHSATLVIYYDTITCISCMMNSLDEWVEMFSELKNSCDFTPLFIFEPAIEDSTEYRRKLYHANLPYPVFSDYYRTFRSSNPVIAANSHFRTFLLDRHHRIVLAGYPLHNMIFWEVLQMYIATLQENGGELPDGFLEKVHDYIASRTKPQCGLLFDAFRIDAGNMEYGSPQTVTFNARNATDSPIEITDIISDCDCVEATASVYSVSPGKTCIITVSFTPDKAGSLEHHVFIRTSASVDEIHLIITGNSISFG